MASRGNALGNVVTLPERQDVDGAWHQVVHDVCYGCGCTYLVAEDDHDLVWEPGGKIGQHCTDELCECHASPKVGERRD